MIYYNGLHLLKKPTFFVFVVMIVCNVVELDGEGCRVDDAGQL